jgi:hypothetical protein
LHSACTAAALDELPFVGNRAAMPSTRCKRRNLVYAESQRQLTSGEPTRPHQGRAQPGALSPDSKQAGALASAFAFSGHELFWAPAFLGISKVKAPAWPTERANAPATASRQ